MVSEHCLTDYEFPGWQSSSRDYGVVRAREGEHRILAEIAPEYAEELGQLMNPSAMELNRALYQNLVYFIAAIESRYRSGQFVEEQRGGSVFRIVRVT